MENKKVIKGYKGFDEDMKCRGFQYEVGKEYKHEGTVKACKSGFHFCENPLEVFGYYPPNNSKYAKVEGSGDTHQDGADSKVSCSKIKIGTEISLHAYIKLAIDFVYSKIDKTIKQTVVNNTASNTGNYSAASNTGDRSAAINTGDCSAAINTGTQSAAITTGTRSAAINTGDCSAAINTGTQSAAINTGKYSVASNTGDWSAAINTGDRSAAINTGTRSAAITTGDCSAAINTGTQSAAINTGYQSAASNTGKEGVASSLGIEGKAKGTIGCFLVLAEWKEINNEWHRISVKSVKIGGKKIKANTWYQLKNGKFVEA